MKFRAKILPIATKGPKIGILNYQDAQLLDIQALDRVRIRKDKISEVIAIDLTYGAKEVERSQIGLFLEVAQDLGIKQNDELEITIETKPESLEYIRKKLNNNPLSKKEIDKIIKNLLANKLTDVEATYFVAGCYTHGMSLNESTYLAESIVENGGKLKFNKKPIVDKHCVGGLPNNRTTPIIVPIIAATGLIIPKTSTRSITSASVTYDTPVLIKDDKKTKIIQIGKFVDKIFNKNKDKLKHVGDGEYIKLINGYKAPAFDKEYKIKERDITGIFRHKAKDKEILNLILETGRKVSLTEDHSIFTLKDGKITAISAKNLNEGSLVVVPRSIDSEGEIKEINILKEFIEKLPDNILDNIFIEGLNKEIFRKYLVSKNPRDHMRFYRNLISIRLLKNIKIDIPEDATIRICDSKIRLPIKLKINKEFIRLLGYYAAEGHCGKHSVEFYLGSHEKEFIKDLSLCIKKVFNVKAKIKLRESKPSEADVIIGTKAVSLLFNNVLNLGNNAYKKRVPDIVFNVNTRLKEEYFKAFIEGDGNKRSGKHTGYEGSTTSEELMIGLQYIASYIDIAYSTRVVTDVVREFESYTSYCAPAYHIYTQKENRINPSSAYIRHIPIEESGLKSLLDENIQLNNKNNDSKLKYKLLNQDTISLEKLKNGIKHLQYKDNYKIKRLIRLINGDLAFLRIKKIERVDYKKKYVYDLCLKDYENFIGGYGAVCLHNSGTADVVEILAPVEFSKEKIMEIVNKTNGCMVWGGTLDLASADDKLIQLEKPLSLDPEGFLLASILAKKAAVGATHVLVDIPIGEEAKIKTRVKAEILARKFITLGERLGMKVRVIITDGSQPIGNGVGPALEAIDILKVLQNDGPKDLKQKSLHMAGLILEMVGIREGHKKAEKLLESGAAYRKMQEIIKAQGGNPDISPKDIKLGAFTHTIRSSHKGKLSKISNRLVTKIAKGAGAPNDKGAGIYLHKKLGDNVEKNEALFTIYAESKEKLVFAMKENLHKVVDID